MKFQCNSPAWRRHRYMYVCVPIRQYTRDYSPWHAPRNSIRPRWDSILYSMWNIPSRSVKDRIVNFRKPSSPDGDSGQVKGFLKSAAIFTVARRENKVAERIEWKGARAYTCLMRDLLFYYISRNRDSLESRKLSRNILLLREPQFPNAFSGSMNNHASSLHKQGGIVKIVE